MSSFSRASGSQRELRFWKFVALMSLGLMAGAIWLAFVSPHAAELPSLAACTTETPSAPSTPRNAAELEDEFRRVLPGGIKLQLVTEIGVPQGQTTPLAPSR